MHLGIREIWMQLCYMICNLHTSSALTSSAGLVKEIRLRLQGSKPNHIWLSLRIRNTTSPCPPQFNINSLAAHAVGFGVQPEALRRSNKTRCSGPKGRHWGESRAWRAIECIVTELEAESGGPCHRVAGLSRSFLTKAI